MGIKCKRVGHLYITRLKDDDRDGMVLRIEYLYVTFPSMKHENMGVNLN